VDFERQTLREGLEQAGFAFEQPTVFSWVGVTMYLTIDAINATLAAMAQCRAGTRVVLTYNQPWSALSSSDAQITGAMAGLATRMGEPFISRFLSAEIAEVLQRHGFGEITDFGPDEARAAYFPGRPDVEIAGAQRLVAATLTLSCPPGEASELRSPGPSWHRCRATNRGSLTT
jgi:O-methyltransferase involved in polyketide biosynthesis